jgi:hypothetical protein
LHVHEVSLPDRQVAVEGPGLPRHVLAGPVTLDIAPLPRLRPGWNPDGAAVLWNLDDTWSIAVGEEMLRSAYRGGREPTSSPNVGFRVVLGLPADSAQ